MWCDREISCRTTFFHVTYQFWIAYLAISASRTYKHLGIFTNFQPDEATHDIEEKILTAEYAATSKAWSLMRSKSDLGADLRRQHSQLSVRNAITALAHKLARIFYGDARGGISEEE